MKKVLLTLAVLAMLVGCRSQKKVVKTEIATADTCSVSSASTMATERLRWMDSLTLDLDSFEIEWRMAPGGYCDRRFCPVHSATSHRLGCAAGKTRFGG